jgi:hypothetical protein
VLPRLSRTGSRESIRRGSLKRSDRGKRRSGSGRRLKRLKGEGRRKKRGRDRLRLNGLRRKGGNGRRLRGSAERRRKDRGSLKILITSWERTCLKMA